MRIVEWIGVVGSSLAIVTAAGATGVWAANQHYVTQEVMLIKEIRDLKREIRAIEVKEQYGEAKTYEIVNKGNLEDEVENLEKQLEVNY